MPSGCAANDMPERPKSENIIPITRGIRICRGQAFKIHGFCANGKPM
jgi:hypothetical protein